MEWRVIDVPDEGFVLVSSIGISIKVRPDLSGNFSVDGTGKIFDFEDAWDLIQGAEFLKQLITERSEDAV